MTPNQKVIGDYEEELRQAELETNPDAWLHMLAEDAVLTGHDGKVYTKKEYVDLHRPPGRKRFARYDVSDRVIKDYITTVVVTARVDLSGEGYPAAMRLTRTWFKKEKRWLIVSSHWSPAGAPPPKPVVFK